MQSSYCSSNWREVVPMGVWKLTMYELKKMDIDGQHCLPLTIWAKKGYDRG